MTEATLKQAFGKFLSGVTVITTVDDTGKRYGFTANSFTSVSMDPPLVSVCPGKFLSSFSAFASCKRFVVNILAEGQEDISNVFASFKGDRFSQIDWHSDAHGGAIIDGAAAWFSCETHASIPAGDHVILIGRVDTFDAIQAPGLGWYAGHYFNLTQERAAGRADHSSTSQVGVLLEHNGALLLSKSNDTYALPYFSGETRISPRQILAENLKSPTRSATIRQSFSVFLSDQSRSRHSYFLATTEGGDFSDLGVWVDFSDLPHIHITNQTHRDMIDRFLVEQSVGHFGLYVGDETSGDIHHFDKGNT